MGAPDSYSGLNYWLKADALALSDGDPVSSWPSSAVTVADPMTATLTTRPTFVANVWNGLPVVRLDGIDDTMMTATTTVASMFANNLMTLVAVVRPRSGSNVAAIYNNHAVFSDSAQFVGMHIKTGLVAWAYNYDGTADAAGPVSIPSGTKPVVLMMRHSGGTLFVSINGGAESSVASGNQTTMTGRLRIGNPGSALRLDADYGELCVYNNGFAVAQDRADLVNYLLEKWVRDDIAIETVTPSDAGFPALAVPQCAVDSVVSQDQTYSPMLYSRLDGKATARSLVPARTVQSLVPGRTVVRA